VRSTSDFHKYLLMERFFVLFAHFKARGFDRVRASKSLPCPPLVTSRIQVLCMCPSNWRSRLRTFYHVAASCGAIDSVASYLQSCLLIVIPYDLTPCHLHLAIQHTRAPYCQFIASIPIGWPLFPNVISTWMCFSWE